MQKLLLITLCWMLFAGNASSQSPLFVNSVASTTIDFIKATDPDEFISSIYIGQSSQEMPNALNPGSLIDDSTYVFEATFSNGKVIGIWCSSSFGNMTAAQDYVDKLTPRLGKLPGFMRDSLHHVVIHTGSHTSFAEDVGKFFVTYADNIDIRISNNDFEETVFHESVHVAIDLAHRNNAFWLQAQLSDVTFMTDYAQSNANGEDLAETCLFVYTMCKYPGRLDTSVESWISANIPNRYDYITTNIFGNCATTSAINDINNASTNIVVYPNPASEMLTILRLRGICEIKILDLTGKVIYSSRVNTSTHPVNISDLPQGVYFIRVTSEVENIALKFIKQ